MRNCGLVKYLSIRRRREGSIATLNPAPVPGSGWTPLPEALTQWWRLLGSVAPATPASPESAAWEGRNLGELAELCGLRSYMASRRTLGLLAQRQVLVARESQQ